MKAPKRLLQVRRGRHFVAVVTVLIVLLGGGALPLQAQLEPIYTRWAETSRHITVKSSIRYFEDVELQEADHFDGWSVDFDLTVPFWKRFQLRTLVPIYTSGEARLIGSGQKIDIDGYSGIFDQPSLFLEHQVLRESNAQVNVAYYLGVGSRLFEGLKTSVEDTYNHKANVGLFGLKADHRLWEGKVRLVGNGGIRYFMDSDDLNPSDSENTFVLGEAGVAAVFQPVGGMFHPVAEFRYETVDLEYNAVHVIPEMIAQPGDHLELKLGVPIGLGGDGATWEVRFQVTGLF